MNFHWAIKFENGNEMGGCLKAKTFDEAHKAVEKIIADIKTNLGYKVSEFTIRQGKLVTRHYVDD